MKKSSKRRPKAARGRKQQAAAASRAALGPDRIAIAPVRPLPPAQPAPSATIRDAGSTKSSTRAITPAPKAAARRTGAATNVASRSYGADDRRVMAMLLMPFILVAFAVGFGQSLRSGVRPSAVSRAQTPAPVPLAKPVLPPSIPLAHSRVAPAELPRGTVAPPLLLPSPAAPDVMRVAAAPPVPLGSARDPVNVVPPAAPPQSEAALPATTAAVAIETPTLPEAASRPPPEPSIAELRTRGPEIAAVAVPEPEAITPGPVGAAVIDPVRPAAGVCVASPRDGGAPAPSPIAPPRDPAEFGNALASAALAQTREFVVYNDKYRRIGYPMGDVSPFYGVCTDVLIRAFRALSIDLQVLVQQTRSGSGDPNIDHRRVDTLRRFFAAHGQSIPITEYAEDYRPGDIVSYWRPQNRHSRTHIAIVANEIGPSGRPMIIHNRGWGPQLEDGLFVDQITGHYRFNGLRSAPISPLPSVSPRGAPKSAAAHKTGHRAGLGHATDASATR